MAPRSLPDTESARAAGSAALSQSNSSAPRNRAGDAPIPVTPMSGVAESCTPARLRMMPVCAGQRPDKIVAWPGAVSRSEEHTSELQSQSNLVCRLLLEKKKQNTFYILFQNKYKIVY